MARRKNQPNQRRGKPKNSNMLVDVSDIDLSVTNEISGLSDEVLAVRAAEGQQCCFEELVSRYSQRLYGFFCNRIRFCHDAEDLVQETFIKAYTNIDHYNSKYAFCTWLFTIGRNLAISHFRRTRHIKSTELIEKTSPDPYEMIAARDQVENIWQKCRSLRRDQYDALWFRYAEELSIKEISMIMGKRQGHVKVLLCRARMNLLAEIKRAESIEEKMLNRRLKGTFDFES